MNVNKAVLFLLTYLSFVHASPFEIPFSSKKDLTNEDYIEVQRQVRQLDITSLVRGMYTHCGRIGLISFEGYLARCSKCINQTLINTEKGLYPKKELVKIGQGGDRCFVCCGPLNGKYPTYILSMVKALEEQGFNGYFLYYIGGWPNPTGEEIKYAAVPYCFKIFAMVEAHQAGFNNVLWVDAACFPLRDVEPLFELLDRRGAVLNWFPVPRDSWSCILPQTRALLFRLTGTDVLCSSYINSIVLGLKMNTPEAQKFIAKYYEYVKLGTPFLSCFPEEWVFTAIIGQKEFRSWLVDSPPKLIQASLTNADDSPQEFDDVRSRGYYFYQRKGR